MLYKRKWPLLIFLVPSLVVMFVFLYYPFLSNLKFSFYDMTSIIEFPGRPFKFIGLENYQKLISDKTVRIALVNSFKMMGLTILFQVGIALVLAILVSSIKKAQQLFRTVYFFPIVISATAIGLLFKLFYTYDGGMLNQILEFFNKPKVHWLSETLAFTMIAIPVIWSYVGFYFVILLTGLSDISDDLYEAAAIDGCTGFKQVIYITLPLLRGVLVTCVTLAVTGALKVFDLPWIIAPNGAPQGLTHFLGTYMYQTTFGQMTNYDYGAVLALVIVILGVLVAKVTNWILKPDANL